MVFTRRLSYFFFFLFAAVCNLAANTDSLKIELTKATSKEVIFSILIKMSDEYTGKSSDTSLMYANKALDIANNIKDKKTIGKALYNVGYIYNSMYDDQHALEFFRKSFLLRKQIGDKEGISESSNAVGNSFYFLGQLDSAEFYLNYALGVSKEYKIEKEEAAALFNLGNVVKQQGKVDNALEYYLKALKISNKLDDLNGIAKCHNNIGLIYFGWDKYDSAIRHYKITYEIRKNETEKKGAAIILNNMGNVYWRWSKYDQAIVCYQKALEIFEKNDYKRGVASCQNNIGLIYENLVKGDNSINENDANFRKALEFHGKALIVNTILGDELQIARGYNNIGNVIIKIVENKINGKYTSSWKQTAESRAKIKADTLSRAFDRALLYYKKSSEIMRRLSNKEGIASILNNIGRVYFLQFKYEEAKKNFEEALILSKELNNKYEIAINLFQIALIHKENSSYAEARIYFFQALDTARKIGMNDFRKQAYENLSEIYEKEGDYRNSLVFMKRFIGIRDSIFNEETNKMVNELQTKYESEKKDLALRQASEKDELSTKVIRQQRLMMYAVVLVLLIIAGFLAFVFRQNSQIKKANILLAEQNDLISKQHKEITDSIHYAQRIQRAILPPVELIEALIPERFILFRPRDIVSGDYYWLHSHGSKVIVAAADCTGHGVPGAFMSMLGVTFLSEIVGKNEDIHANEILNIMRENIIRSLHQKGKIGESQDGMDMAIYIIDMETRQMQYAGANNSLVMIRNNEVIQYKADKMPVGIHIKKSEMFTNNIIDLLEGDCIYTFSDGYQDQFGGPDGRKLMIKNMKEFLLKIHQNPMAEQRQLLDNNLNDWIGEEHEQIDDVLVIGVKVKFA